jgi:hypothetical protein
MGYIPMDGESRNWQAWKQICIDWFGHYDSREGVDDLVSLHAIPCLLGDSGITSDDPILAYDTSINPNYG